MRALVYQTGSLGDTIVSLPALRLIRNTLPALSELWLLYEDRIRAVTPKEVLASTGLIDHYLTYTPNGGPLGRLCAAADLCRRLRALQFSKVYYLVGSKRRGAAVLRDKAFFKLCGISEQYGFHALSLGERSPRDIRGIPREVENERSVRVRRLLMDGVRSPEDITTPPQHSLFTMEESQKAELWLRGARQFPAKSLVAICPGSNMPSKEWAIENFVELGDRLLALGGYEIVVIGGAKDRSNATEMIQHWGAGVNACGRLSVPESAHVLAVCRLCISVDSGPMHLAAAVGTPCVALFSGRDHPGRWDPPADRCRVVRHPVKCGGCMCERCPDPEHPCMSEITVTAVWEAVEPCLAQIPASAGER